MLKNVMQSLLLLALVVCPLPSEASPSDDELEAQLSSVDSQVKKKDYKSALQALERLMNSKLTTSLGSYTDPGQEAFVSGVNPGRKLYTAPQKARVCAARATIYEAMGDYQKGLQDRKTVVELLKAKKPEVNSTIDFDGILQDYPTTLQGMLRDYGADCLKLGDARKSVEIFTEAINLSPHAIFVEGIYTKRAEAHEKLGEKDLAAKDRAVIEQFKHPKSRASNSSNGK